MKIVVFGLTDQFLLGQRPCHAVARASCGRLRGAAGASSSSSATCPYYAQNRDLDALAGRRTRALSRLGRRRAWRARDLGDADVAMVTSYCPDALAAGALASEAPRALSRSSTISIRPSRSARLRRGEAIALYRAARPARFRSGPELHRRRRARAAACARRRAPRRRRSTAMSIRDASSRRRTRPSIAAISPISAPMPPTGRQRLRRAVPRAGRGASRAALRAGRRAISRATFPGRTTSSSCAICRPASIPPSTPRRALTLNVTRRDMAAMGWCPVGPAVRGRGLRRGDHQRRWAGLEAFFEPDAKFSSRTPPRTSLAALDRSDIELRRIGEAARERVLAEHTRSTARRELGDLASRAPARAGRCRRLESCGASFPPPAAAAASSRWPSRRNCCRSAAAAMATGERPCAVSEYLVERMICGGADKLAFVIGPGKSDILDYYGAGYGERHGRLCRAAAARRALRRDLPRRAADLDDEPVLVGLPDTVWFPENGFAALPDDRLVVPAVPGRAPGFFDAVLMDEAGRVQEIEVKRPGDASRWIWGAFKMPARVFHELHRLWLGARPPRRIFRHAGQCLSRGGRRGVRRQGRRSLCRCRHAGRLSRGDAAARPAANRVKARLAGHRDRRAARPFACTAARAVGARR